MKRVIIIGILILIILIGGCCKENGTLIIPSVTPYEKGQYYEIYDVTKHNKPQIQYFVFDNDHEIMDYGVQNRMEPYISMKDGIIEFLVPGGTSWHDNKYFDPKNKLISEWFPFPFATYKTLVVYMGDIDGRKMLIVQDMFDKSKYYRTFERDFTLMSNPVAAEFINDGKQLRITYKTQTDQREATEILDLT